ncbi:MAG: methylaspartate mutase accessory protein GlmL [Turicibacter sp.]|nr:methylaspartate mutase accessory protein GlmL [Turicibacter sp.]
MNLCLAVDFGSTYTKLTAIDVEAAAVVAVAKAFTTIETDVREGLNKGLVELAKLCGTDNFNTKLACSSAAGGLKMISVGLVPDLTAKAARLAATSAGAKVVKTYAYELTSSDQEEIFNENPDIILLSGGIDGGNKDVILHNAQMLAVIERGFSVIIAGNKTVGEQIRQIFLTAKKRALLCENVMPKFDKLNIMPAKMAIRDLFIENIISAKGLDKAQELLDDEIIPTPLAVFEAAELLGKEMGELMVYDVGGATTDVYSMADGTPKRANTYLSGMHEPHAKRTVEGDIGMRYSILSLAEEAGLDNIAASTGIATPDIQARIKYCRENPDILSAPNTPEKHLDDILAGFAIGISANRHCGFTETTYTPVGEVLLQTGKDLTAVKYIIGTGGSVINNTNPKNALANAAYTPLSANILKPTNPEYLLDTQNIFAAMGLLSKRHPKTATKIMQTNFTKI